MKSIIDVSVEEVESQIKDITKVNKLTVINTDDSTGNKWYANSLVSRGKELNIEVEVVDYKNNLDIVDEGKVLVLKPEDNIKMINYNKLIEQYKDKNIEPNGIQLPTIKAICKLVEIVGTNQDVLVINRSRELGLPLAHQLIQENHTVTVAHRQSCNIESKFDNYDVVIEASGAFKGSDFTTYRDWGYIVIDVSGRLKQEELADNLHLISNVGRLTTSYAMLEVTK